MLSLKANRDKSNLDLRSAWSCFCRASDIGCLLGIDEDDEHEEEDEEGVSLLEVKVPQDLGDFRKAVAGKQTAHL